MLNDKKYRVPKNTSEDNKILWIVNSLECKLKIIKNILRENISDSYKCEKIGLILRDY